MTVEEVCERMSGLELQEWIAFDRISPIGDERADLRAGIVASVMANCHRSKGEPFKPQDFMPFLDKPRVDPLEAARAMKKALKGGR
jgi:hypothetical protein